MYVGNYESIFEDDEFEDEEDLGPFDYEEFNKKFASKPNEINVKNMRCIEPYIDRLKKEHRIIIYLGGYNVFVLIVDGECIIEVFEERIYARYPYIEWSTEYTTDNFYQWFEHDRMYNEIVKKADKMPNKLYRDAMDYVFRRGKIYIP